jgi:hypothetical protein
MLFSEIPTCPTWASDRFVVRKEKRVLVQGLARWFGYPCPRELMPGDDLLAEYRRYAVGDRRAQPLHLVLAGATNDQLLEDFVRLFGPLGGRIESSRGCPNGAEDIVVSESWRDLRHKQKLFRNLFQLVSVLREKKSSIRVASQIADCAMAIRGFEPHSPHFVHDLEILAVEIEEAALDGDWTAVFTKGHEAVCHVFALFPTRMIPYPDGAVDLPKRNRKSVLAEAIFMLKKDYASGWAFSFCRHPDCQKPFRIFRRDQTCCSEECGGQLRYRKYYRRRGYKVRRATLNAKKAGTDRPNGSPSRRTSTSV